MKTAVLLASLLGGVVPSLAQECEVTIERAGARLEEVLPAVEKELGTKLAGEVPLRIATVNEIADIVARENEPFMETQFGVGARAQAQAFGDAAGAMLLAKYAWSTKELLVVAENFPKLSAMIERPDLCSDAVLRALLVHELVHAHDHRRYGFDAVLVALEDPDRIRAYNAVIEGHAQHVARKICAAHGWSAGFETYVESLSAMPKAAAGQGSAVELLTRVVIATVTASYVQGERFIAALAAAGGDEAIARAFAQSPADMEVVYHPEWFLDPSLRPAASCDFDGAIALATERFPESEWLSGTGTITPEQLRIATSMIPAEQSERMISGLIANRIVQFGSKSSPQARTTTLVFYEFRSADDASWFVAGDELVMRAKDEQMKTGTITIESARYEPFERGGSAGFVARKQMKVGPQAVELVAACAARGRLVAETTILGETATDEEHFELLDALLRRAARETSSAGGAERHGFDDLELGPLPDGWTAETSTADRTPNEWRVVEEQTAPSGTRVLALSTDNAEDVFNVLFAPGASPADVELSVSLRALSGKLDQGGGLVWRARDASNYYLARWNPLEQDVSIYVVTDGRRELLRSAESKLEAGAWHELAIVARGANMHVRLDGQEVLAIEDATIDAGGRAGLWTKADASTAFDDLEVLPGAR